MTQCSGREWDKILKQAFLPTARLLGTERQASLDLLCAPSGMADGDPPETHDHGCREALQTAVQTHAPTAILRAKMKPSLSS